MDKWIYLLAIIYIFESCSNLKLKENMAYKISFYTQYQQFYIYDKKSPGKTDSNNFWTKTAHKERLALEDGVLGIGTECYGPVKAELIVLDSVNNAFDIDLYDHIVEGGIDLKSGILQVLNCPDFQSELDIELKPGKYRIRVYSSNLTSVIGDEGDDFYKIEIWPDNKMEREVLKQYMRY